MAEMDAEKMARTIVDEYVCQLHAAERKGLYGQIRRALTTAHNAGLERAAETCAERAEFYRLCSQAEGVDPDLAMQREYAAEALETLTILIKEQSIPKKVHP